MMIKKVVIASVLGGLLISCNETEEPTVEVVETPTINVDTTDVFGSDEYEFKLPNPIQVASSFKGAGMTYQEGKTNPTSNLDNYVTKSSQLLNFGVYSADLAYCVSNGQTQTSRDYLTAVEKLANKFGMGSVFSDAEMIEKFDKNIGNQEILEDMLIDIQEKSEEYLEDNDMRYFAAVQFAGAWIEGMYLGAEDIVNKPQEELKYAMLNQMTLLNNTIRGLEAYPNEDEKISAVLANLKELQDMFNSFESVKAKPTGVPDITVDEASQMATMIKEIRASII